MLFRNTNTNVIYSSAIAFVNGLTTAEINACLLGVLTRSELLDMKFRFYQATVEELFTQVLDDLTTAEITKEPLIEYDGFSVEIAETFKS